MYYKKFLTINESTKILNLSYRQISCLLKQNDKRFVYLKIGNKYLINVDETLKRLNFNENEIDESEIS